ncbi:MAG: hypothetical protein WC326_11180 [Candidatus Delongbacteria bacterium]
MSDDTIHVEVSRGEACRSRWNRGGGAAKAGIGLGTALAVTISWSLNKSLLWAILHGIFSWFYVIYYAIWLTP